MINTSTVGLPAAIVDLSFLLSSDGRGPRGRALESLARKYVGDSRIKYLLSRDAPQPSWLEGSKEQSLFSLSNAERGFVVVSLRNVTGRAASNDLSASVVWRDGSYKIFFGGQYYALPLSKPERREPGALDLLALEKVQADGMAFHIVDPALASDKDVMRTLVPLARSEGVKLVVLNRASAFAAPEIVELDLSEDGALYLVSQATSVLIKSGVEPELASADEIISLGGKAAVISSGQIIKGLALLEPQKPSEASRGEDAEAFFADIKAAPPMKVGGTNRLALVVPISTDDGDLDSLGVPLAQALSEYCDVELWSDGSLDKDEGFAVRSLDEGLDASSYDQIAYLLGNDPAYGGVLDALGVNPGTVILRDAHLMDLLDHRFGLEALKVAALRETGSRKPAADFGELMEKARLLGSPLLSPVCSLANGIVTSGSVSANLVREKYHIDVNHIPAGMPYTFTADELSEDARREAKTELGLDVAKPCIIAFGKVDMRNGSKRCLIALHELKVWGADFEFVFVGAVKPKFKRRLESYIESYGLKDSVRFTGKLSVSDYRKYLKAGDIALQMNDPSFGQMSSGLLDAVSAGTPSLASEGVAQALEAPSWVRTVNDKAAPFIYAEHLFEMINSGTYRQRPVEEWQSFTQSRSLSSYAKRLVAAIFGEGRA